MSGLTSAMSMAVQDLLVQQEALNVTTNNIANANTPGYARQRADLVEVSPQQQGSAFFGAGVALDKIESIRDGVLELQIQQQTQEQANSQAQLNSLQQVENLFSDNTHGIGNYLTAFFNSLSQLSADPTSLPSRQGVLAAANNLADSFNQTTQGLASIQSSLDQTVTGDVAQINRLTSQIAQLNTQVAQMQNLGQNPGALEDQRTLLVDQLSGVIDVSVTNSDQGYTLTTGNGSALVVAGQSFALQTSSVSGSQHILAAGQDITSALHSGDLAGVLQVRDQFIPGILSQLDTLAGQLSASFNTAHQAGFDLNGNPGTDFFAPVSGPGAALNFSVQITDPTQIAASSDQSPGSNGNLAGLIALGNQTLPSGQTPLDSYSSLVVQVGNATSQAKSESDAGTLSLQQLNQQRSAVSGVSLDEETTNLLRYQQAFEAAARVISTVDQLTQTVLAIGSATGH